MNREQFRKAGYAAIDRVCDYFESIENGSLENVLPDVQPGDISKMIPKEAPVEGEPWANIAADFEKVIMPGVTHWQHPMFTAYYPCDTNGPSILADIYAGAVSNPGFSWLCCPSATETEASVIDWVAKMLGLDETWHHESKTGGGVIMGSASESCLTVCIAARERFLRMYPDTPFEEMVIVGTTQTHSLGAKAALILGLKFEAIETLAEDDWSLRGHTLRTSMDRMKSEGKKPFILLATLGSTSTGAIDNIAEITAVAADYPELFIHIDAAWGGVFLALPELREECQLAAINARSAAVNQEKGICASGEVHSFCTNLHKSGLVTFDASCLWIRDRRLLTEALDVTPPFLRNRHTDEGTVVDYRNWQIPLGRRFRSLKIYFVLRSYGISGFQAHLRQHIEHATYFEQLVLKSSSHELFVPRRFSLVVLRLKGSPDDESSDPDADALNREFHRLSTERRDIMLTPTTVGGRYCTRVAIGSPFMKKEHVDKLWAVMGELEQMARGNVPRKRSKQV